MKFFIAIAVVLAILVLTQAQDESNQSESESESPTSDEPVSEIPLKPIRPGRHPIGPRPHLNENQGRPQRQPVIFDIIFDFGSGNEIVEDAK